MKKTLPSLAAGLCWRTTAWTPAHAGADCDADPLPKPATTLCHTRHTFGVAPLFDFASTAVREHLASAGAPGRGECAGAPIETRQAQRGKP